MTDPIWFNDVSILLSHNRLTEFFPIPEQSMDEKLNAIVRLSMYTSLILIFYHSNLKYINVLIFFLIFTYVIRPNEQDEPVNNEITGVEKLQNELSDATAETTNTTGICTKPTIDNPFMNVTMKDYLNVDPKTGRIVDRPPACDSNLPDIKKEIDVGFNNNLFKDVSDVFGKVNSQRNYYTTPNTTIPNDRESFANWLYLAPKTCKEDQDYCLKYEDIRGKKPIYYDSQTNPEKNAQK